MSTIDWPTGPVVLHELLHESFHAIPRLQAWAALAVRQYQKRPGFAFQDSHVGGDRTNSRLFEVDRGNSRLLNTNQLQINLQIPLTSFSGRVHSLHDADGITRLLVRRRFAEGGFPVHEPGVSWPRGRLPPFAEDHPLGALQIRGLACPGPIPSKPR